MQSDIRIITYLSILLSPALLAEVYTLDKNETVSELLYKRLKISPIYRGGYLKDVLEFNNLTPEDSRSLSVGTKIRLPLAIAQKVKVVAPELNIRKDIPPEPDVPTKANKSFYIGINPTIEVIKGDIDPSEITTTFFYPQTHIGFVFESVDFLQILNGSITYVTFKRDRYIEGNNNFLNGGISYQFLKKQSHFFYGIKLNAENSILVVSSEDNANYSLKNPLILSIGPSLQLQVAEHSNEVNFLYAPSQQVDADNDLKSSIGVQASSYRPLGRDTQIGIAGAYSQNQIEDTVIYKASLAISGRWQF